MILQWIYLYLNIELEFFLGAGVRLEAENCIANYVIINNPLNIRHACTETLHDGKINLLILDLKVEFLNITTFVKFKWE